ncbi:MAG: O-antigen ligase family protein, partial [Acetobacteraceae bacterium]
EAALPPPADGAAVAAALGAAAAALQFAAALKSLPGLAALPADITPPLLALVLALTLVRLAAHRHRIGPEAAVLVAAQGLLALWLAAGASWSGGVVTLERKLAEIVLLAPAMTLSGLAVAAHPASFRAFAAATAAIGLAVALLVPIAVALGLAVLGGAPDPETIRVQYQVATLSLAAAVAVIAATAAAAGGRALALGLLLCLLLALASFASGGRAGLLGLTAAAMAAPAATFAALGNGRAAVAAVAVAAGALAALAAVVLAVTEPEGLPRTLARLLEGSLGRGSVRPLVWQAAIDLASPLGLGAAGFAPAAGFGDLRGWHPHSLALEAVVEGGLPGAALFGVVLLASGAALARHWRTVPAAQAGATVGLACVAAAQLLTSTDLGNRMAWMWFGLVAGLSVRALPRPGRRTAPA